MTPYKIAHPRGCLAYRTAIQGSCSACPLSWLRGGEEGITQPFVDFCLVSLVTCEASAGTKYHQIVPMTP